MIMISYLVSLIQGNNPGTTYSNLDSGEFRELINNKTKGSLLDVRTRPEFAVGHIDGAGQLNFYSFDFRKKLLLLPRDKPVYLYCNTGYRSRIAARFLSKNGYSKVYNLEKGIMDWELHDMPVIAEAGAKPDTRDKMEADEFNALVSGDQPVLIDFYAPWCAPCRTMMPMIEKLTKDYDGMVRIVKINADASKTLVKKLQIGGVPYFVIYQKGEILYKHQGVIDEQAIRRELKKYSGAGSE
ncbi:MAG: thioredoxin domain-containing protein [Bacteroidales bacterium]|nr:thioredoxin domain-containing protein [Bacteroidales bacterium]